MKFPYIVKYGGIRTDIGKHFYDENKLLSLIEYGRDFFISLIICQEAPIINKRFFQHLKI